jgi:hypothetical protein
MLLTFEQYTLTETILASKVLYAALALLIFPPFGLFAMVYSCQSICLIRQVST